MAQIAQRPGFDLANASARNGERFYRPPLSRAPSRFSMPNRIRMIFSSPRTQLVNHGGMIPMG